MAMQVWWTNKKGIHCSRMFSDPEMCWSFMDTLRTRAVVKENGEVIGRIEHRTDGHQDQPGNRQWFGWLDMGEPLLRKDWDTVVTHEEMSAADEYKMAIQFDCPFCGVKAGVRCTGNAFPQYPHNLRTEAACNA